MLDRLGVRTIQAFAAVAAFALTSGIAGATQSNEWRSVEIVGGEDVPGIVFNTSEPDLIYARTDIEGAYRWNPSTRRWIPLLQGVGFDAWNLTSVAVQSLNHAELALDFIVRSGNVHQYAFTGGAITGDPRVFGRVYIATNGHGIIYGEPRARRGGPH